MPVTARWLGLSILAALQLSSSGCDDGDAERSELRCAGSQCSADCRALAGGTCDVLTESCRERVLRAVSCARGSAGRLPQIRILSEQAYRRELSESSRGDAGTSDGASPDPDDDAGLDVGLDAGWDAGPDAGASARPELDSWSIALGMLGLLPEGTDVQSSSIDSSADFVAGYYESDEQRITLIDRG
ncbi:MAG TPA: hypothetical protein VK509_08365, partial [Polyangiales bacterium]|nr:hypothetical protein [Polyangiales bacterium]